MFEAATSFNQSCEWNSISSLLSAQSMFSDSGLVRSSYNDLLVAWSAAAQDDTVEYVTLDAGNVQYGANDESIHNNVVAARDYLRNTLNWTIYDNGIYYRQPDPTGLLLDWRCTGYSSTQAANWTTEQREGNPRTSPWWDARWVNLTGGYVYPNLLEFNTPGTYVTNPYQPRDRAYNSGVSAIDITTNPTPSAISAQNLQDIRPYIEEFETVAVIQEWDWDDSSWDPSPTYRIHADDFNEIGRALNNIQDKLICTQYESSEYCFSRENRCGTRYTTHNSPDKSTNNYTVYGDYCGTCHGRQNC